MFNNIDIILHCNETSQFILHFRVHFGGHKTPALKVLFILDKVEPERQNRAYNFIENKNKK